MLFFINPIKLELKILLFKNVIFDEKLVYKKLSCKFASLFAYGVNCQRQSSWQHACLPAGRSDSKSDSIWQKCDFYFKRNSIMAYGVTGNTSDFGSEESRFEP